VWIVSNREWLATVWRVMTHVSWRVADKRESLGTVSQSDFEKEGRMKNLWMMRLAIAAAIVGMAVSARADSMPAGSYELSGVAVDGYQLTGSVTLNANGVINAANVELVDAALNNPQFTQVTSAGGPAGYAPVADYAFISDPGVGQIELQYLTNVNSSGDLSLCILSAHDCNSYQASYLQIYNASSFGYNPVDLSAGGLDPQSMESSPPPSSTPAATPEPTSLALLGIGILGVASLTHTKKRRRG
jgi:hypothetical protein